MEKVFVYVAIIRDIYFFFLAHIIWETIGGAIRVTNMPFVTQLLNPFKLGIIVEVHDS